MKIASEPAVDESVSRLLSLSRDLAAVTEAMNMMRNDRQYVAADVLRSVRKALKAEVSAEAGKLIQTENNRGDQK